MFSAIRNARLEHGERETEEFRFSRRVGSLRSLSRRTNTTAAEISSCRDRFNYRLFNLSLSCCGMLYEFGVKGGKQFKSINDCSSSINSCFAARRTIMAALIAGNAERRFDFSFFFLGLVASFFLFARVSFQSLSVLFICRYFIVFE